MAKNRNFRRPIGYHYPLRAEVVPAPTPPSPWSQLGQAWSQLGRAWLQFGHAAIALMVGATRLMAGTMRLMLSAIRLTSQSLISKMRSLISKMRLSLPKFAYAKLVRPEYHWLSLAHYRKGRAGLIYLDNTYQIVEPSRHSRIRRTLTYVIDLSRSEDDIFRSYNDTTRNEVRRAIRDGVTYEPSIAPSLDDIHEFLADAEDLMIVKNRPVWDFASLSTYRDLNELVLTKTKNGEGKPQSYHVFIRRGPTARLINSVTIRSNKAKAEQNFAGRANRLNHWEDAKFLKTLGVTRLDLGGWAARDSDTPTKGQEDLKSFKEGLGAQIIPVYHQLIPVSLIGRVVMKAQDLHC
jgi:hypothetical protein